MAKNEKVTQQQISEFSGKWRITHGEPMTYNERVINSACKIIDQQIERIEELEEIINRAVDGIETLSVLDSWPEGQMKKDVMAIKECLENVSKQALKG